MFRFPYSRSNFDDASLLPVRRQEGARRYHFESLALALAQAQAQALTMDGDETIELMVPSIRKVRKSQVGSYDYIDNDWC